MKLPIRNFLSTPLTIFVEPYCDEYEIPEGGEAQITLSDGHPHSIDVHPEQFISIWDEGSDAAKIEIFDEHQLSSRIDSET